MDIVIAAICCMAVGYIARYYQELKGADHDGRRKKERGFR